MRKKEFSCLKCGHCKTRVFKKKKDLLSWCGRKAIKPSKSWVGEVTNFGHLRLLWCEKQTDQYSLHGFSPRNASSLVAKNIEKILEGEKTSVFISNKIRRPFIFTSTGVCPLSAI